MRPDVNRDPEQPIFTPRAVAPPAVALVKLLGTVPAATPVGALEMVPPTRTRNDR